MAKNSSDNAARTGPRSGKRAARCPRCGVVIRREADCCANCGLPNPDGESLRPPTPAPTFKERWLPVLLIAAVAFVAYLPCLDNGFVSWDDDHYIYKNHQVHYPDGIKSIWFDVFVHGDKKFQGEGRTEDRVSHQYYPMVFTLYWLEFKMYQWFGNADPYLTIEENIEHGNMGGFLFHLDSVLLHMVNVMLLIFCFRQLGVSNWVAWAATLLFALHPMQASSVAWAAERKNIISLLFYLLSLMSYIKLRRDRRPWTQKWWRYALALVLYQSALFSKTVSLTLPVMLFFTDRLLERRWDLRLIGNSLLRIAPFAALSCVAAWTTINVEDRARTIPITDQQRPLLPAATLLWYAYKMLLPLNQSPVYSLWPVNAAEFAWYLPSLAVLLFAVLVIVFRKRLAPAFLWALLFYCVTQGPMLGIKNINYFQFAYVADHYFYHGAVGLMLMLALAIGWLADRIQPGGRGRMIATGIVCVLGLAWGVRTFTYVNTWTNAETFWGHILARHPNCWPGWYNTANARKREAIDIIARLEKPKLTEEERTTLRNQAEALRAEVAQDGRPTKANRLKILRAYQSMERSQWPDLTPDAIAELEKRRDTLLADAAERYQKVKEIHKQISQPYDQWISVCTVQKDWCAAFAAADEAAHRFPQLVNYHEQAGRFAYHCEKFAESLDAYQRAAKLQEAMRNKSAAVENLTYAAISAEKVDDLTLAAELLLRAGQLTVDLADAASTRNDHCTAAKLCDEAVRRLNPARKVEKTSAEANRLYDEISRKLQIEKQLCPQ